MDNSFRNKFHLSEWSGAVGDLGTLLPLAFALVIYNEIPPARLFLLWGLVYIVTGWYYRVPVSVQPLKAMAVIAIAKGFNPAQLSSAAFFYGIILLLLSASGIIRKMQSFFSPALVRGIQLGIGLILAQKAVQLVLKKGLLLHHTEFTPMINIGITILLGVLLILFQFRKHIPLSIILIGSSLLVVKLVGFTTTETDSFVSGPAVQFSLPDLHFLLDAVLYLIIPQLPLTLGNAVFAANDACHSFWKERSGRVTPTRLSFSIGTSNILIGLLGGFPICHGAGGIAAHAQFGAKTGGATIIIGSLLITGSLDSFSNILFLIPVPLLSAMLIFDSRRLIMCVKSLQDKFEIVTAGFVGILSFATQNLAIALAVGFLVERAFHFYQKRIDLSTERE